MATESKIIQQYACQKVSSRFANSKWAQPLPIFKLLRSSVNMTAKSAAYFPYIDKVNLPVQKYMPNLNIIRHKRSLGEHLPK